MKIIGQCSILLIILLCLSCSVKPSLEELKKFSAKEIYPSDTYLDSVTNKRALVILAHDDDDCAMSGTISKLKKAGWKIEQWTLGIHPLSEGRENHPSGIICEGNKLILADGHYRNANPKDSNLPAYMPVPRSQFPALYETEKVSKVLIEKINKYQPTVIFTLDNEMGAYGNPDHVFISQLVLDLFLAEKISVQRIYQGVYTNSMEKEIIEIRLTELSKNWGFENTYLVAKKVYGIDGMPEPNVEINIRSVAGEKMAYLRAYHEKARKNIKKFIPYYEDFDAQAYFSVFDREFFRIMRK